MGSSVPGSSDASLALLDIVRRSSAPVPWVEGEKIPWDEPKFSRRMLAEHLQEDHDAASRRPSKVDAHVSWIHEVILSRNPSNVLDLGCGPGLYTRRLAILGHRCTGIDFSPASIQHAEEHVPEGRSGSVEYALGDVREAEYGLGRDLVVLLFGELNAFTRDNTHAILKMACECLGSGGRVLLEVHTFDSLARPGERYWNSATHGLFSDSPYLHLGESFWVEAASARCDRHYIVDARTGKVTRHGATHQAYTRSEYDDLLRSAGFDQIEFHPSLVGVNDPSQSDFEVIVAARGE